MTSTKTLKIYFKYHAKSLLLSLFVIVLGIGLMAHVPLLNGSMYWQWPWRHLSGTRVFIASFFALIPFMIAFYQYEKNRMKPWLAISLLCLSTFLLQFLMLGIQNTPFKLTQVWEIIINPLTTSYFTDASILIDTENLLEKYPTFLPKFHLHTMTKPPGPLLFNWFMIKLFGNNIAAALAGGIIIAIGTSSIPLSTFLFAKSITNSKSGFYAACAITLTPGLILFFPELDQCYPIFTCGMIGLWLQALIKKRVKHAIGAVLFFCIGIFFTYSILVLGAVLLACTFIYMIRFGYHKKPIAYLKLFLIAITTTLFLYFLLWLITGFNPFQTFLVAYSNQQELLLLLNRPYPISIIFDLWDFLALSLTSAICSHAA